MPSRNFELYSSQSAIPQYQHEVLYTTNNEYCGVYVVSPIIIGDSMPLLVVRTERERIQLFGTRKEHRVTEYQYGVLCTSIDDCFLAADDEMMEDSIRRVLGNFVIQDVRLFPLYIKTSKYGEPEVRMSRSEYKRMQRNEGNFWTETVFASLPEIGVLLADDKKRITNGVFPAMSDPMAIKKYHQFNFRS